MMPNDASSWHTVCRQARRWLKAGVFEAIVHDMRMPLRTIADRAPHPTAVMVDGRALQSSPEGGERAECDGAKRRRGSSVHAAVDTLGHLLALLVTPANAQGRAQVAGLAGQAQETAGEMVEVTLVGQGYTGGQARAAAEAGGTPWRVAAATLGG